MPNLNKCMLMGSLTRDPEVKYTPKGTAVAELGLAVNRTYKTDQGDKREEVTFVDVELWGRQAELAGEHLKKGRPVYIEGRLKLDTWDDKQTGQKRSKLRVVCENFQFLGDRDRERDEQPSKQSGSSKTQREERPSTKENGTPQHDIATGDEDDLPFNCVA